MHTEWIKKCSIACSLSEKQKTKETGQDDKNKDTTAGNSYNFDGLSKNQQNISLVTVITINNFLLNSDDYTPLQATVSGAGRYGKCISYTPYDKW